MPRICVIANPTSGRGAGGRMIPTIERLLKIFSLGIPHAVELLVPEGG